MNKKYDYRRLSKHEKTNLIAFRKYCKGMGEEIIAEDLILAIALTKEKDSNYYYIIVTYQRMEKEVLPIRSFTNYPKAYKAFKALTATSN